MKRDPTFKEENGDFWSSTSRKVKYLAFLHIFVYPLIIKHGNHVNV
jgi:hypothetical protein